MVADTESIHNSIFLTGEIVVWFVMELFVPRYNMLHERPAKVEIPHYHACKTHISYDQSHTLAVHHIASLHSPLLQLLLLCPAACYYAALQHAAVTTTSHYRWAAAEWSSWYYTTG